ncbi:autotransporter outer membrane beta-barrel domain-containing protein [Utexia brackfieldae]|uniref:autotransporter outer membrane beta-barrel domain-containing protein n=1 Tax=Utexia brackfieldae TaxID=3074108 RepID=UPI00370DC6CA
MPTFENDEQNGYYLTNDANANATAKNSRMLPVSAMAPMAFDLADDRAGAAPALDTDDQSVKMINPDIGAVLGAQQLASQIFKNNPVDDFQQTGGECQAVWGKINANYQHYDIFGGRLHNRTSAQSMTIGTDLYRSVDLGAIAGGFASLGQDQVRSKSAFTDSRAELDVKGVSFGGYLLLNSQAVEGAYLNSWITYAHLNNQLKNALMGSVKYNANQYMAMAETGYKLLLANTDQNSAWYLKPNGSVSYGYYKANDMIDHTGTAYTSNKMAGFKSCLGVRLFHQNLDGQGLMPFMEVNGIYNGEKNKLNVNLDSADQTIGQKRVEVKLGVTGNHSKNLSAYGFVSGQKGSHDNKQLDMEVGISYAF